MTARAPQPDAATLPLPLPPPPARDAILGALHNAEVALSILELAAFTGFSEKHVRTLVRCLVREGKARRHEVVDAPREKVPRYTSAKIVNLRPFRVGHMLPEQGERQPSCMAYSSCMAEAFRYAAARCPADCTHKRLVGWREEILLYASRRHDGYGTRRDDARGGGDGDDGAGGDE